MKKTPSQPLRLLAATSEAAILTLIVWAEITHFRLPATLPGLLILFIILACGSLTLFWLLRRNYPRQGFRPRVFFYGATALLSVLYLVGPGDYTYFPGYTAVYFLLGQLCLIGGSVACYKAGNRA